MKPSALRNLKAIMKTREEIQMKTMTKKEIQAQEKLEAANSLKEMLEKANYTVYTSLNHVSSSGMTRWISCYITLDNEIVNIDWYILRMGLFSSAKRGIKVGGCGMDMGFHVVYTLSSQLFRNEDDSYSHDGAYKVKQRWL